MDEILIKYIQDKILVGEEMELSPEEDLLETGLIDSIGMMRLIGFIEEEFDLTIPPQDLIIENFMSVSAIREYLERVKA